MGAGPAGLAAAVALGGVAHRVEVLERHGELRPALGAGFNLTGGAVALARLGLADELARIGNPIERVRGRACDAARGPLLNPLLEVDLAAAVARFGDDAAALKDGSGGTVAVTVMRDELQRVLAAALPSNAELRLGARVEAVREEGGGAVVTLGDGSEERYDLLVCADGIRSVARQTLFGTPAPRASNIRILFGVAPDAETRKSFRHEVQQWFGDGAYCLSYTGGRGEGARDMMALCISDADERVDENTEWDSSAVQAECMHQLSTRGFPAELEALAANSERWFEIGVRFHDTLATWSSPGGAIVLLGDSAHAMPPFLGQGANQALQDAYVLAARLAEVGGAHASVKDALLAYEAARIPPTAAIVQSSRGVGFLETLGGPGALVRDAALFAAGKLGVAEKVFLASAVPRLE